MADLLLDEQSFPVTPSAGQMLYYPDNSNSQPGIRNDGGLHIGQIHKAITAQIAAHSVDTYYGLGLQLPSFSMQAGMLFEWTFMATKGAAGTATPIYNIRIGAAQTTADTSRLTLTGPAQTAAADTAIIRVVMTVRSVGLSASLQGFVHLHHNLAATGFANAGPAGSSFVQATSVAVDNTVFAGLFVGLSVNPGTSGAWVVEQAFARCRY